VMRTRPECREVTVVAGTAEVEFATKVESPTRESYHVARTLRTLGGTRAIPKSKQ
jgi:hypothetical protein